MINNFLSLLYICIYSQGKASLNIANLRGDTPLKMLQMNAGSIWVGSKVLERIRDESQTSQRQRFILKLTLDKVSQNINHTMNMNMK